MKRVWIVSLAVVVMASCLTANAAVVAMKRDAGLTDFRGLDPSLTSPTVYSGQGAVADAFIYTNTGWATDLCYANSGAAPVANQQYLPLLVKFGLNQLPGFAGSTVTKAQVRFYATGGNGGMNGIGYITSSDWSEGNKAGPGLWGYPGDYPGLGTPAAGVSGAHPNGLNTGSYQDANGVSQPGMPASWANNQVFSPSKDGVYSGSLLSGTWIDNYSGLYLTEDITSMAQLWANGTPNFGLFIDSVGNYNPYMSEETAGVNFQPVLVMDYSPVPEPASLVLLALGGLGLLRRRGATC